MPDPMKPGASFTRQVNTATKRQFVIDLGILFRSALLLLFLSVIAGRLITAAPSAGKKPVEECRSHKMESKIV